MERAGMEVAIDRGCPMTLAEFTAARLDEREAAARAVLDAFQSGQHVWTDVHPLAEKLMKGEDHLNWPAFALANRTLREVAAMRAIVAEHARGVGSGFWCIRCDPGGGQPFTDSDAEYPCKTLRALAAVWSDHEQYDVRWKP